MTESRHVYSTNTMSVRVEPIVSPPAVPGQFRIGYRPSLDGLRAFAVLAVMAHHGYFPYVGGGAIGVDIFFVLSGFLITSLLWEEWYRAHDISLRRFYLRRILRLIPALAAFLLFVQCYSLAVFHGSQLRTMEKTIAAVILYIANWVEAFQWFDLGPLSHAWSLSIEEQFYMIWPLGLLLLLRFGLKQRWIVRLLIVVIIVIAIRRGLMWAGSDSGGRIYFGSDTRFDELLSGCALGIWIHSPAFPWNEARSVARYMLFPALAALLLVIVFPPPQWAMYTLGWPLMELAVGIVIVAFLLGAVPTVQKLFELPPAVWIGRISYGLYLWHAPILGRAGGWSSLGRFRMLAGLGLSFAAASASYYLLELRFLRRKRQLSAG